MKSHLTTIIFWALLTAFAVQAHAAFAAFITLPFVLIYLIACIYFIFFKKRTAKHIGITLSIIAGSYLIVGTAHFVRFKEARSAADLVATKVQRYKAMHGAYPASSLELGVPPEELRNQRLFYKLTDNGPVLFYPATQAPFDTYSFNFQQSQWVYQAD